MKKIILTALLGLFLLFPLPDALAADCVAACPAGQTPTGNCQIDPDCNPGLESCPPAGVTCSAAESAPASSQSAAAGPAIPSLNPFCFTTTECKGAPYNGIPSPQEAQECLNLDARYTNAGFRYYCYSPQPEYDLQVSLGLGTYKVTGLGDYIKKLYIFLVGIAGIAAGIMIVWAGVIWLTSAGSSEKITNAKKKIGDALVGLVFVLGSVTLLQAINPALTSLKLPPVMMARQELQGGDQCVERDRFVCSRTYQCDDSSLIDNPPCIGGIKAGTCEGQWCPPNNTNTCAKLMGDRISRELKTDVGIGEGGNIITRAPEVIGAAEAEAIRGLFTDAQNNKNVCVGDCGGCAQDISSYTCISSACNCILALPQTGPRANVPSCSPRASGPVECYNNEECASGRCNTARDPDLCVPTGGEPDGAPCAEDADCTNKICNTLSELTFEGQAFDGICQTEGSLAEGDDCDRGALCGPGLRCVNEAAAGFNINVSTGGKNSGPQSSSEIAGINAECEPIE